MIKVLMTVGLFVALGLMAPQLLEKIDVQLQLSIIGGFLCH